MTAICKKRKNKPPDLYLSTAGELYNPMNTRTFLIAMALLVASSQALFRGNRYNRNAYRYRYEDDDSCSDDNRYVVAQTPNPKPLVLQLALKLVKFKLFKKALLKSF